MKFEYVLGSHDVYPAVMISEDGKILLIKEYESYKGGEKYTVRVERLDTPNTNDDENRRL